MKKIVTLCVVVLSVSLLTVTSGCRQVSDTFTSFVPLSAEKTSLEEASSIMGVAVPVPSYLPKGYKIQEAYIEEGINHDAMTLLISDKQIDKRLATYTDADGTHQHYEFQCKMQMDICHWHSEQPLMPIKVPDKGKRVKINESKGVIMYMDDHNELWWQWDPNAGYRGAFEFRLSASKRIGERELVRVAESVRL